MAEFQLLSEGLSFPESPAWSARGDCLYFVEWHGDRIQVWQNEQLNEFLNTEPGSGPSGLCLDAHGNFWTCLYSSRKVVCYGDAGNLLRSIDNFEGSPFRGPCDIAADRVGGVYFTDSGDFEEDWFSGRPAGAVYYVPSAGGIRRVDLGLCFPNGIALSPDDEWLYVNEHRLNRTLVYQRETIDSFMPKKVLFQYSPLSLLPAESAFELGPDGMSVDDQGCLWVAHYGAGEVLCISPQGVLLSTLKLPKGRMPTSTAYSSTENSVYITEAEFGLLYRCRL
jgi:gluconolactonase